MDIFKVLSRGATIQRNGKHRKDLTLLNHATPKDSQDNVDIEVARETDFFKTKTDTYSKKRVAEEAQLDNEEEEEAPPPIISTPEEAVVFRNKHKINITGEDSPLPIGSFEDLITRFNLHPYLLANLKKNKYTDPTPIQCESIPTMLNGRDLIACAPTGSGKTMAYSIPMVEMLGKKKGTKDAKKGIKALVVAPTKELASQIYNAVFSLCVGVGKKKDELKPCLLDKSTADKLRNGKVGSQKYDICITTPLRLVTALNDGSLDLGSLDLVIFDEADKLFEKGFATQVDDILAACPSGIQKTLFSATIPASVEQLANSIMSTDPLRIIIGNKQAAAQTVEQKLVYAGNEEGKLVAIRQMAREGQLVAPVIIFLQSIDRAKALFKELVFDGINVDQIHGAMTAAKRASVIDRFRNGEVWVLICTDVLARGIDFRGINLVINYDVPQSAQSYVHRIGRTGRAGRLGKAVTFFTKEDATNVKVVVNVMKQSGQEVPDWLNNLAPLTQKERDSIKNRPVKRKKISTQHALANNKKKRAKQQMKGLKKMKKDDE